MKMKGFLFLGIVLFSACVFLSWFAITSYPQVKSIEEREQYLESLDWIIGPDENLGFWDMGYGCSCLEVTQYGTETDQCGVMKQDGTWIIPCEYEDIAYLGGAYFAARRDDYWHVYDFQGREIAKMQREAGHLYYAGGTWFVRYPDFESLGFEIIDVVTGRKEASFEKYYSGTRLPDGTWYVSKNPDFEDFDRQVENNDEWDSGYTFFEEPEQTIGFFLDEDFQQMYDGQEYSLTLIGDGCYAADRIIDGRAVERVILDGEGEFASIPKGSVLHKRTEKEYNAHSLAWRSLAVDKEVGISYIETHCEGVLYMHDFNGDEISREKPDTKGFVVSENEEGYSQVTDAEKNIILKPYFSYIENMSGWETAEVCVDGRSGLVRLKGGANDAT